MNISLNECFQHSKHFFYYKCIDIYKHDDDDDWSEEKVNLRMNQQRVISSLRFLIFFFERNRLCYKKAIISDVRKTPVAITIKKSNSRNNHKVHKFPIMCHLM